MKENSKEEASKKNLETSQEAGGKQVEKVCPPFKFEHEMAKIKISVPLNELIRKGDYREHIIKTLPFYRVITAIFLLVRVSFQSRYCPCVQTYEVRYIIVKGLKSTRGWLALGSEKGCQS
jgi:hypothetical protein